MDGLYRISGKANDLLKLKKEFDNGVYRTYSVCTGQCSLMVCIEHTQCVLVSAA